jgi:PAS domain-containing protein
MKKLLELGDAWTARDSRELPLHSLFSSADTAVMIAEWATGQVIEVNLAALLLLGMRRADLVGTGWLQAFSPASAQRLALAFQPAGLATTTLQIKVDSRSGKAALSAAISMFRVDAAAYILVRLTPGDGAAAGSQCESADVLDELEKTRTSFVVTNEGMHIEYGNRAFLELVQVDSLEEIRGSSLTRWLGLTESDLQQLQRQMQRRQAATVLVTTLHAVATARPVEVTAIAVPDERHPCWGFTLDEVGSRNLKSRARRADA